MWLIPQTRPIDGRWTRRRRKRARPGEHRGNGVPLRFLRGFSRRGYEIQVWMRAHSVGDFVPVKWGFQWVILICFVHFNILNEHVFYIWSNALETKWGFSGMPCLISRGCAGKVVCSSLMLIPLLSLGNCINYYSPPFQVFNHILSHSYIIFKKTC